MKTLKLLFTATAVAVVAIATAVEKPRMNVVPVSADRALVSIQNENAAYFELSILAQNGDIVYYKQSTKPLTDYQKVFDFENLENGSYVMNLKVNDTQLSRNVEIFSKEILVGDSKLRFDPFFEYNNDVLKFSFLNFDKELYKISIIGDQGLVYKSKVGDDFALTSGYNLSALEKGNYRVVLSSWSNEYVYSLVK